jgi:hypothetical protein
MSKNSTEFSSAISRSTSTVVVHSESSDRLDQLDQEHIGGIPMPLTSIHKPSKKTNLAGSLESIGSTQSTESSDDSIMETSETLPIEYPVLREFIFDAVELNQSIIQLKQQILILTKENTELKSKLTAINLLSKT